MGRMAHSGARKSQRERPVLTGLLVVNPRRTSIVKVQHPRIAACFLENATAQPQAIVYIRKGDDGGLIGSVRKCPGRTVERGEHSKIDGRTGRKESDKHQTRGTWVIRQAGVEGKQNRLAKYPRRRWLCPPPPLPSVADRDNRLKASQRSRLSLAYW